MSNAVGPIYAAGFQHVTKSGYTLVYLPDLRNDELQREGRAPVYYWLPQTTRLARKENGDYKFSFLHFAGVRNSGTNVGVGGKEEVSGGLVGFSTTMAPPEAIMREMETDLLNRFRGNDDRYWGWRTTVAPMFRPVPIVANTTSITNLAPNPDGTVPTPVVPPVGDRQLPRGYPPVIRSAPPPSPFRSWPRSVPLVRGARDASLGQWYVNLQGQGPGAVNPFAESVYSGLVGSMPALLLWSSFHGGTSPIAVYQFLKIKVWSPIVHLEITSHWSRIQQHLSAAAHAGGLFWSADLKAQFNTMRTNGLIEVKLIVDSTLPNAAQIQEAIEKRSDLVYNKFMEHAQKAIFEPPAFTEKPAEASGGFLGFGGGGALKLRRDTIQLDETYIEDRELAYLQDYPCPGQLDGLYDELRTNPAAEKKYFQTVNVGDWDRVVARFVTPVVNWPDPAKEWAGEPVAFLSAQIGYPNSQGVIQWDSHMFQRNEGAEAIWNTRTLQVAQSDVANPPAGWTPDKTFVKRQIHFVEPPSDLEHEFVRVQIEKEIVELDPPLGTLSNDINLEVRVDNAGALSVGPISLGVELENAKQVVEVTFRALGKTATGLERTPVKFSWEFKNQEQPRYWMVFTGQPDFVPRYQYQVRVVVKGSIFSHGTEWTGPWEEVGASGPLIVRVPTTDDPGVRSRSLALPLVGTNGQGLGPSPAPTPPPAKAPTLGAGMAPPPVRRSGPGMGGDGRSAVRAATGARDGEANGSDDGATGGSIFTTLVPDRSDG